MNPTFSFYDWHDRRPEHAHLPPPPDHYRPGHTKWGGNYKISKGIQNARKAQQLATNRAFFFAHVLPLIAGTLNAQDWKDLAHQAGHETDQGKELLRRGGWTFHPEFSRWTHPEVTPREHWLCQRIAARLPVPAEGLNAKILPAGWVRLGDEYVFPVQTEMQF